MRIQNLTLILLLSLLFAAAGYAQSSPAEGKKWYIKGNFGAGAAFEEVSLFMTAIPEDGGSPEDVKIGPGGGLDLSFAMGYVLSPKFVLEADIGYQSEEETPVVKNASGSFSASAVSLTCLYKFLKTKRYEFYLGAGVDYFISPKLTRDFEPTNLSNEVNYDSAPGMHCLVGMQMPVGRTIPLFFYVDMRVDAGMKYNWNKHVENGVEMSPFPEWEELNGDQLFFDFGLMYYVK